MRVPPVGDHSGKHRGRYRVLLTLPRLLFLTVLGFVVAGAAAVGVIVGARMEENGNGHYLRPLTRSHFALNVVHPALSTAKAVLMEGENVPLNLARGLVADVERLSIDIDHLDYQQLAFQREEALEAGYLFADGSDYVPARITTGPQSVRVRLRLKGDQHDHFETDKWSFRIRVRGEATLFGMKRFSLQHPKTRNWIGEKIFLAALEREGLIAPRYRFVDVTVNGTHKGIYALEEHFDSRLIEHGRRRAGPIVRFDEDLYWRARAAGYSTEEYAAFSSAGVDGYSDDKSPGSEFERAARLLEAFRKGELATTEVFDGERLALYVAMRDLAGSKSTPWQNFRFYYDPVTSKLEPIAFDCEAQPSGPPIEKLFCSSGGVTSKGDWYVQTPDDPLKTLFSDRRFFALYVQALERLSSPDYLDQLYAHIEEELAAEWRALYREYPYYRWSDRIIRENQAFIRAALSPPRAVSAHRESTDADVRIRVGNLQSLPVEILGLATEGGELVLPLEELVLPSKRTGHAIGHAIARFPVEGWPATDAETAQPNLIHRILGTTRVMAVVVQPWAHAIDALVDSDRLLVAPNPERFSFLDVDEEERRILVATGGNVLAETLILPAGYTLFAGPDTHLDLRNGAAILARGPLDLRGDSDAPVVVESSDGTGQGIVVIRAGPSTLRHVELAGLRAPEGGGWRVPGAVTFYESPVTLEAVSFRDITAEDALNVMRTSFDMRNTIFTRCTGDAFDGDFVEGRITGCVFSGCGNDAIDVSGSVVRVDGARMSEVGDKALSVGEESEVQLEDTRILKAGYGIACKDRSHVRARNVDLRETAVGFCVFQKKTEFGPAVIEASGITLAGVEREHMIEIGSRATLDGIRVEGTETDVAAAVYGPDDRNETANE